MGCSSSKPEGGAGGGVPGLRVAGADFSTSGAPAGPLAVKVVMMGEKATGKSSVVMRFIKGQFTNAITATIGAAFASKDVTLPDSTVLRLQIWDTSGEEIYRAMTRSFFREAKAGVLLYDITSDKSFSRVKDWLHDFREVCPDAVVVVVGNKLDLEAMREVATSKGSAYAYSEQLQFFEVSAKEDINVTSVFEYIAQELAAQASREQSSANRF